MTRIALLLLALALTPCAAAVDLLPTQVQLSATEARFVIRSAMGSATVRSTPSVLAAGAPPGGDPAEFAPTPRTLAMQGAWRGIEDVVEVVLRRETSDAQVEILVEDGTGTGVWLDWAPTSRGLPGPGFALLIAAVAAAARTRRLFPARDASIS